MQSENHDRKVNHQRQVLRMLLGKDPSGLEEGEEQPTPAEVRDYLLSQPLDRQYSTRDACGCPLGCFIREARGYKDGCFKYDIPKGCTIKDCPKEEWAIRYAYMVDQEPGPTISGRRALELLHGF